MTDVAVPPKTVWQYDLWCLLPVLVIYRKHWHWQRLAIWHVIAQPYAAMSMAWVHGAWSWIQSYTTLYCLWYVIWLCIQTTLQQYSIARSRHWLTVLRTTVTCNNRQYYTTVLYIERNLYIHVCIYICIAIGIGHSLSLVSAGHSTAVLTSDCAADRQVGLNSLSTVSLHPFFALAEDKKMYPFKLRKMTEAGDVTLSVRCLGG